MAVETAAAAGGGFVKRPTGEKGKHGYRCRARSWSGKGNLCAVMTGLAFSGDRTRETAPPFSYVLLGHVTSCSLCTFASMGGTARNGVLAGHMLPLLFIFN